MRYKGLVIILFLLLPYGLSAQSSFLADTMYIKIEKEYRTKYDSLKALGETEALGSLYVERGLEMSGVYNQFPDTEIGLKALENAFGAWLNIDSLETMEYYLERVSPNNRSWHVLANWYRFGLSNRQVDPEHFYNFADSFLKNESITNLETLSYLNYQMGRIESRILGKPELALSRFEKVIKMNVDEFEVEAATRDMYDILNLQIGSYAPTFSVTDISGNEISLSDLKGKYVFLEFWATWCGPCIPEIPYLKEAYQEFGSRDDFVMIGISLDRDEEQLKSFLDENDMNWIQILDGTRESKWKGELGHLYAVGNGIPKTFLIDKEGKIIATELRKEDIISELSDLLKN